MKLARLIDSALIVVAIALLPGIANAQTVTSNSNVLITINSNHTIESQLTSFKNTLSY